MDKKSYKLWLAENNDVLTIEDLEGFEKYKEDEEITKAQFLDGLRNCSYCVKSFSAYGKLFEGAV